MRSFTMLQVAERKKAAMAAAEEADMGKGEGDQAAEKRNSRGRADKA